MHIRRFTEIGRTDGGLVGGKGASLGELTRFGVAVPPGFVVTTGAFRDAVGGLEPGAAIAGLDADDLAEVSRASAAIRARIEAEPLPEALRDAVVAAYRELGDVATP